MTINQIINDFIIEVTSQEVTSVSAIFKIVVSMILGAIVGIERKRKGQNAGVRTFALICMGATLAMLISIYVPQEYLGLKNGDPGRIAAQVISGIGFLGAGAIIQMKGSVRGLTTAAGIWMIATIGLAVGLGLYIIAIVATGLILIILHLFERMERRIAVGSESRIIQISLEGIVSEISPFKECLKAHHISLTSVYVDYDYVNRLTTLNLVILAKESTDYLFLFNELSKINKTQSISLATQINH